MKKLLLILLAGCFSPHISDGKLHCAADRSCPDGFTCAADNTCWSHPPTNLTADLAGLPDLASAPDLGHSDLANPDLGLVRTAHRGMAMPAGSVKAQSQNFKVLMSTGAPPGGNAGATSASYRAHAGFAGATQ